MKKFSKAIGIIFLAAVLVFWGADRGLDWLIDHLGIVVLANGDISLPETTEETTTAKTKDDPVLDPMETLPSLEETTPEETLPEETLPNETTTETLPAETTPEETLPEETLPQETTAPEITTPETTVPETTVPETTEAPVAVDPEDAPEVLSAVESKYCYQYLNETEKKIYRQMYLALSNCEEGTDVENLDTDRLYQIYLYVYSDCPEFFWVTTSCTWWNPDAFTGKRRFDFDYCVEIRKIPELQNQINAVVNDILAKMPEGSDYEKAKWTYEYLVKNTNYVWGDHNQNIISTFLLRETVCAGYARAFQHIMQKIGISCAYITGMAGEYHAWNLIFLDGEGYYVDVTWGDPLVNDSSDFPDGSNINYAFLCASDAMMELSHTVEELYIVPKCDALVYNYYWIQGTYFETYNKWTVYEQAERIFRSGNEVFEMQFSNNEAYRRAVEDIGNGFYADIWSAYEDITGKKKELLYYTYDSCRVIKIIFE